MSSMLKSRIQDIRTDSISDKAFEQVHFPSGACRLPHAGSPLLCHNASPDLCTSPMSRAPCPCLIDCLRLTVRVLGWPEGPEHPHDKFVSMSADAGGASIKWHGFLGGCCHRSSHVTPCAGYQPGAPPDCGYGPPTPFASPLLCAWEDWICQMLSQLIGQVMLVCRGKGGHCEPQIGLLSSHRIGLSYRVFAGGISGIVVGLSAQAVLGNMVSGLNLYISRPFVAGRFWHVISHHRSPHICLVG